MTDFTIGQTEFGLTITKVNNKNLEVLNVPEGVTYIGRPDAIDYLFSGCKKLREVVLPTTLKRIELYAFNDCRSLESVVLTKGLEFIGDRAFEDCSSLKSINIPDSVKSIGVGAFCGCENLRSIHLPSGITELANSLFFGCKNLDFNALEIPQSVTRLGNELFASTNIESFYTPENVTVVGNQLFSFCKNLKHVTISDSVKELGYGLFGQEVPAGLKVRLSPNIEKTDIFMKYDTSYNLFATFPALYEMRKDGIFNKTLGKMVQDDKWDENDFE